MRRTTKGITIIDVQLPSEYLQKQELRLLDMPGFNGEKGISPEFQHYLLGSDGLLFVLDARAPFTGCGTRFIA